MKVIDLNGDWEARCIEADDTLSVEYARTKEWFPAIVPGTIHTDLMKQGIIPDPYFRMDEKKVQWVELHPWTYRRVFEVEKSLLDERSVTLTAEGLDTYAAIVINGKKVGSTENMFVHHQFSIKKYLKTGRNEIEITFDSPVLRSQQQEKKNGKLRVALEPHRVYVRKAQYSFGWDWGPKLTTSGIWRPIFIEATSSPVARNPFAKVIRADKKSATVELSVDIEHNGPDITVLLEIEGHGFSQIMQKKVTTPHVEFKCSIDNPELWWPNGYGEQPLYLATFRIQRNDTSLSEVSTKFGIRAISLIQQKDKEGKSFVVEVNGVKIFCKGADWIPCDNFIPRIADTTYERLITMAREAHMNMLRVWGGGIYEQDIFYELCDRHGILVWQDFMFACGEYPEKPSFLQSVTDEASKVVKRLRNHPCIAMWCGNNECEWLFCTENPDKRADDMTGAIIFNKVLPGIVKKLDGSRPYWRSSPFGEGFPNDVSNGTHHQWHVWSFWKDYKEYEQDTARYVAEFGFQAPANIRTWETATVPLDRSPQSPVIEHHNKQIEGQERLYRFQAAHYTIGSDFTEFVYRGQLVQANALKTGVEHWRRRKFLTSGTLFWQLNDCWPVSSWSVIDSGLRPKAGYYYAKRFYTPVLISITGNEKAVTIWGTNDVLTTVEGNLNVDVMSFDGKKIFEMSKKVVLSPNSSGKIYTLLRNEIPPIDPGYQYIRARLLAGEDMSTSISENRLFFAEPKHLALPFPRLSVDVDGAGSSSLTVTVRSDVFAKDVYLFSDTLDFLSDDNCFDLDAGENRVVRIHAMDNEKIMEHNVRIMSLLNK